MDKITLAIPKTFARVDPKCLTPFNDKYSSLPLRSFPFLLLSSSSTLLVIMMSECTSPALFFTGAEEPVQFQCPAQETGFTTSDIEELLSLLQEGNSNSNSGSPNSGSEGSNRAVYSVDERQKRRKTSNRESARRSRWRKKRHLEDLTEEASRLRMENRELKNRLGLVAQRFHVTWRENERLESESLALWARLSDLNRVLVAMQMQQSQY